MDWADKMADDIYRGADPGIPSMDFGDADRECLVAYLRKHCIPRSRVEQARDAVRRELDESPTTTGFAVFGMLDGMLGKDA